MASDRLKNAGAIAVLIVAALVVCAYVVGGLVYDFWDFLIGNAIALGIIALVFGCFWAVSQLQGKNWWWD